MTITLYKLTDSQGRTRPGESNELTWAPGVTHEATGVKPELCSDGLLHAYEDSLLAVFLDPIHGGYGESARMFECTSDDEPVREGQLKCGVRRMTCVREVPLPRVTAEQRVKFAIYCAAAAQGIAL